MQAYKIMARNVNTGLRIQQQFLDGSVIRTLDEANRRAQRLAEQQSQRTRETWVAEVELYTVAV